MKDNTCTYILIPIYESQDKSLLDRTIGSITAQTLSRSKIRVLIDDNAFDVNSYRSILQYEIESPDIISVIHEKTPTTRGRMLKHMVNHLRFSKVDYIMIMEPGDVVYPTLLEKAMRYAHLCDVKGLIFEADIWDGTQIQSPEHIYTDSCLLNELCREEYYRRDGAHKVIVFYVGWVLMTKIKLPYYSVIADYYDQWFSLIVSRNNAFLYVDEVGGAVCDKKITDPVSDLVKRSFLIKRNLYTIETGVRSTDAAADIETREVQAAYHNLAMRSLQLAYAMIQVRDEKKAEDCLIYAKMIESEIDQTELYRCLERLMEEKGKDDKILEQVKELLSTPAVAPPREAKCV